MPAASLKLLRVAFNPVQYPRRPIFPAVLLACCTSVKFIYVNHLVVYDTIVGITCQGEQQVHKTEATMAVQCTGNEIGRWSTAGPEYLSSMHGRLHNVRGFPGRANTFQGCLVLREACEA